MGISAVIPAYGEAENLKYLLPQIKKELLKTGEEYEIIVVDGIRSIDNSKVICHEHGAKYLNQEEAGFGGAIRTGIRHASMDKLLMLDGDGSHSPEYIPKLHKALMSGADVAIGSRYAKGGKTFDSKVSVAMSKLLNFIYRSLLGIDARDVSTNYRMYRTNQIKQIVLKCQNYDILEEILLKLKLYKPTLKIKEIPIQFSKRKLGKSKRRFLPFAASYAKTLFVLLPQRLSAKHH